MVSTATVPPLRRSLLVGALASASLLAPVVGAAVSWSRAGRGGTFYAPLRIAGSQPFPERLVSQDRLPLRPDGFDAPLLAPGATDAVTAVSQAGLQAAVTFTEHPVDHLFVLLATAGPALAGITAGVLGVLLLGVVRSTAAREPFAPGNAGRFAAAAGVLVVAALLGTLVPHLAARRLLALPFVDPALWVADVQPVWWPLPVALLLAVLALAVRAGSRLREQTDGLV